VKEIAVQTEAKKIGLGLVSLIAVAAAGWMWQRFNADLEIARTNAAKGSVMAQTHCGLIEYQEMGQGLPLLMVHGSGGGHDQGIAFARLFVPHGVRVIAMSRFGYLRTPLPIDASPSAQADAHACLLDALGISKAAVLGASAGALSAMQLAIRHPDRVDALILLVPIAYKPPTVASSAPELSPLTEKVLLSLIGSDFVFWAAIHLARDQVIKRVLATPPELVEVASSAERMRVNEMIASILPVSLRANGLRNETLVTKNLQPYALDTIRAPTLIISAKDDGYGTYANAQYTVSQIAGAKFIGYDTGGHLWIGHHEEVMHEILKFVSGQPNR
jgi:2-hydroxy-6-oxonona-2,4-dienedioate hydrolase